MRVAGSAGGGEGEGEGASPSELALGPHAAAVHLHDLAEDREAQPAAAARAPPRRVHPYEAVEDAREDVLRDAGPGVRNGEPRLVVASPDRHQDVAAGARVLHRVVDEV